MLVCGSVPACFASRSCTRGRHKVKHAMPGPELSFPLKLVHLVDLIDHYKRGKALHHKYDRAK
mgnify:CR=1 FL=1